MILGQCSATPRAKRVRTRAARARALFMKNAVLHACASGVLKIMKVFQRKFIFPLFCNFGLFKILQRRAGSGIIFSRAKNTGE